MGRRQRAHLRVEPSEGCARVCPRLLFCHLRQGFEREP